MQFTIFRAHVYLQTERWWFYTSTIPKTCYNSSKTAGFPLQVFKNSSLQVSEKSEIVATQAPELGQTVRWDLFQASFLTRAADNPMAGGDFDWIVSNHAVWGWKAPGCFSPSALSLFRFHLSPFPPETPDTQAIFAILSTTLYITRRVLMLITLTA